MVRVTVVHVQSIVLPGVLDIESDLRLVTTSLNEAGGKLESSVAV